MKNNKGFIQLPLIVLIIVLILGGASYKIYKNKFNIIEKEQELSSQTEELASCPKWAENVQPTNFPEWLSSAIISSYFGNKIIPANVDKNTFQVLPKSYYKARKNEKGEFEGEVYLPNGEAIKIASSFYAKDKNHVYAGGKVLNGADPATFEQIGQEIFKENNKISPFWRDKNYIWINEKIVEKSDPCSFLVLNSNWSKDKNQVYNNYRDKYGAVHASISFGIDIATFRLLKGDERFAADKNSVYKPNGQIVKNADPRLFNILNHDFEKTDKLVFFRGEIVDGADVSTFIVNEGGFVKDKNQIYYIEYNREGNDDKLKTAMPPNIDIPTFIPLGMGYYKDKKKCLYFRCAKSVRRT